MRTNRFSDIAFHYLSVCKTIEMDMQGKIVALDKVLETLPHIHKKPGYIYEAFITGPVGMGRRSIPYAKEVTAQSIDTLAVTDPLYGYFFRYEHGYVPIIEAVDVDLTPEGIWEYVLLEDLCLHLPLYWHAGYYAIQYILDEDEYSEIAHIDSYLTSDGLPLNNYRELVRERFRGYRKDDYKDYPTQKDLIKAIQLTRQDKLPIASVNDDGSIYLRFYVWNEWEGLKRIGCSATKKNDGGILETTDSETIFNYDCGICY